MVDLEKRFTVIVSLLFTLIPTQTALCQIDNNYTAGNLIDNVILSEKQINDMQAHVKWYEPERNNLLTVIEWGYEKGKEFIEGHKWVGEDKDEPTTEVKYAFNGEVQRNFRQNTGEKFSTGRIYAFTPDTFTVYMTPKALLGYSIKQHAQETFGEILSKAEHIEVRKHTEQIDGHSCFILEAIGIKDGDCLYDVRTWIDTQRDYRPLKIEKFYSPDYKHADISERWRAIVKRLDNIKLKEIDGIWFPVQGDCHSFTSDWLPPEGMTKEEFKKAFSHLPEEKQREKARYVIIPRVPKRRIEVDTIKINKGIDPKKFTVNFPQGCRVWDEFRQIGYVVGGVVGLSEIDSLETEEIKSTDLDKSAKSIIPDKTSRVNEQRLEPIREKDSEIEEIDQRVDSRILGRISYVIYTIIILLVLTAVGIGYTMRKQKRNY
jgi:hypothetical protein